MNVETCQGMAEGGEVVYSEVIDREQGWDSAQLLVRGNKEELCEPPVGLRGASVKQDSRTCLGCGMVVCMALQFSILYNKWVVVSHFVD